MPTDPAEWIDDYWARVQYDDDLVTQANDEMNQINQGEDE